MFHTKILSICSSGGHLPFFLGWGVEWGKNINMKFYHYIVILKGVLSGHFVHFVIYFYFFVCWFKIELHIKKYRTFKHWVRVMFWMTTFFFRKCLQNWFLLECERETSAKKLKICSEIEFLLSGQFYNGKRIFEKAPWSHITNK